MPVVNFNEPSESDLVMNPSCLFLYADNVRQVGPPHVNNILRPLPRAFPVFLKKRAGEDSSSFWTNEEYSVFRNYFSPSLEKITYFLRRNYVAIMVGASFNHDEFSLSKIDQVSPEIYETIIRELSLLDTEFKPKTVEEKELAGVQSMKAEWAKGNAV
jgi:hypothetical protein